jgi:tRNA (mo5U34)-methyltransferase
VSATADSPEAAITSVPLWYHTIELAPGQVTPGWFDLRPILDDLPWPDVRGKRCLDVGTYDGFLAFELERRGASEVIATDILEHEHWDWPARLRARGPETLAQIAGEKGRGFEVAKEVLDSRVERVEVSVYDLPEAGLGEFDVVVCGSLLLHLRDPMRALEGMRAVCGGYFLSSEQIDLRLTVLQRRRPVAHLGPEMSVQWWIPNRAGHRELVERAGFSVERQSRPYAIRFGVSHPPVRGGVHGRLEAAFTRSLCGAHGVPHSAVLARRDV